MLFPIYNYYYESSMNLDDILTHYVENFYLRKYGKDKYEKIQKKLSDSGKVRSLFEESYQKKLAINYVDFCTTVNSIMWFMIQSNETQAVAVLAMASLWNKKVNSHLHLTSERAMRDDALKIFKKYNIYKDMTQEEYDRMRSSNIDTEIEDDDYLEDENEELDDVVYNKHEEQIRTSIRKGFEQHMAHTIRNHGDIMKDPLMGGLMVEAAITTYFESLRKQDALYVIASNFDIDLDSVLDDECDRVLKKYIKR